MPTHDSWSPECPVLVTTNHTPRDKFGFPSPGKALRWCRNIQYLEEFQAGETDRWIIWRLVK